jgi:hypothetical protein
MFRRCMCTRVDRVCKSETATSNTVPSLRLEPSCLLPPKHMCDLAQGSRRLAVSTAQHLHTDAQAAVTQQSRA